MQDFIQNFLSVRAVGVVQIEIVRQKLPAAEDPAVTLCVNPCRGLAAVHDFISRFCCFVHVGSRSFCAAVYILYNIEYSSIVPSR